jgi:hypothetical protein
MNDENCQFFKQIKSSSSSVQDKNSKRINSNFDKNFP